MLLAVTFLACKKAEEPVRTQDTPRLPAVVFENPGDPSSSPQSQLFGLSPEAKGLIGEIQPLLTEAYNHHLAGDYAKSLPAFKRYYEKMIELWPRSQELVQYYFEGRPPESGSFEPLPTRRVVELTLEDMRGAVSRPTPTASNAMIAETCGLLRRHFINFAPEPAISEIERRLSVAQRPQRKIGELVEVIRRDAMERSGSAFSSERYEVDNSDLIAAVTSSTDTSWGAYLAFAAGQRHMKVVGSTHGLPDSAQQAVAAFSIVISSFSGAMMPIEDPLSGAPKGKPIEPYARLLLGQIYSNWLDGNTRRSRNDLVAEHLETIVERYDDPAITIAAPGLTPPTVLGCAMAGLLRVYGASDKSVALAEKMLSKYPNMSFLWNGWWRGETYPEALELLAGVEADLSKKSMLLMRIMEEYPTSWTGKNGSDDGGLYAMKAYGELIRLAKTDQDRIASYKKILASKAGKEPKGEAMFALAQAHETAGDEAAAIKLYKTLAPNYLEIRPLNYDYQTPKTRAAHRMWEIEGKIKPGEFLQPEY
ncbi:MAG: hypothetical protein SF051_05275 [Elusimicrobiota bacterium]|nr:hypothetical protein [Elusimicrobiota bacterium]